MSRRRHPSENLDPDDLEAWEDSDGYSVPPPNMRDASDDSQGGAFLDDDNGNVPAQDPIGRYGDVMRRKAAYESSRPRESDYKPKGWQRALAGVAAGAAGYVNAGGRVKVDPGAVRNITGSLLSPGYGRDMQKWKDEGIPIAAEMEETGNEYKISEAQRKAKNENERTASTVASQTANAAAANRRAAALENRRPAQTEAEKRRDLAKAGGVSEGTPEFNDYMLHGEKGAQAAKTVENLIVGIIGNAKLTPEEKEAKIEEAKNAHNILHPEKPITRIVQGGDGTVTAFTVAPEDVTDAGGSKKLGQVVPKKTKGDGAEGVSSLSDLADEIVAGRQDFHGLTAAEKKTVRPILTARKWKEPPVYSESEKTALSGIDRMEELVNELEPLYTGKKGAPGTGVVVGRLPNLAVSGEGKDVRTKIADMSSTLMVIRSGKAVTPSEMQRIEKFIPVDSDADSVVASKLKNLRSALVTGRSSVGKYAKGGKATPAEDGPPSPGHPLEATGRPQVAGTMTIQKNGRISKMPIDAARRLINEAGWVEVR